MKELMEVKKKLEYLKSNLSYDVDDNYCDLVNTLIDYDNKTQGENNIYLYDLLQEHYDFIDNDLLEYTIREELKNGIERLRCFLNDTYSDTLYLINAYGNLENVDNDTIKEAIDFMIDEVDFKLDDLKGGSVENDI